MNIRLLKVFFLCGFLMILFSGFSQTFFLVKVVDEKEKEVPNIAFKAYYAKLNERNKLEEIPLTDGTTLKGIIKIRHNLRKPYLIIRIDNQGFKGEFSGIDDMTGRTKRMIVVKVFDTDVAETNRTIEILNARITKLNESIAKLTIRGIKLERENSRLSAENRKLLDELMIERAVTEMQREQLIAIHIEMKGINSEKDSLSFEVQKIKLALDNSERNHNNLLSQVDILTEENFHSRLRIQDILVDPLNENCIDISFSVLDKNLLPISSKSLPLYIRVLKYIPSRNDYKPLKWDSYQSNEYLYKEFDFTTERVKVQFCTNELSFNRKAKKKDEFMVKISNKYDEMKHFQIFHGLNNPSQDLSNSPLINNRKTVLVNDTIFVNSESLKVRVWDNGIIDGDTVSLYFNGDLILNKHPTTANIFEIKEIFLNDGPNILLMYANSLGSTPPCSAHFEIIYDNNKKKTFSLSSNFSENKSIIIYRRIVVD